MIILSEERASDSPYVETIMHGRTASDGAPIRPAACHWHMVLVRQNGDVRLLVVGPWTTAGVALYTAGAEILWIKFTLGTFMPRLPATHFLDTETILPDATSRSFWLNGSAWQFPDFGNVETFVNRLVRGDVLVRDPLVDAVLHDHPHELSPRTVRHRFLRATGLTQGHVRQVERAQRAAALLERGVSILDAVHEVGYFDQPHLTRSLRRWIGHTPAQIIRAGMPG
ncbi:MAG: helix-turn-helix domain-containing protein [Chloroflexota bacterium]|nr:helix-turn-helix domain-containing protein [Chloroflexota bacterium]